MSHHAHLDHLLERQAANNQQLTNVLRSLVGTWPEDVTESCGPSDDTVASITVRLTDAVDNCTRLLNMLDEFVMRPRDEDAPVARGMLRPDVRTHDVDRDYAGRLH